MHISHLKFHRFRLTTILQYDQYGLDLCIALLQWSTRAPFDFKHHVCEFSQIQACDLILKYFWQSSLALSS